MLTGAQFTTTLQQTDRSIYLGGPSRLHRQSSMLPVFNAVGTYNTALPTGANLLAVMVAINNLPIGKKIKYSNALNTLYASFPDVIYVTVNPFMINLVPAPGIGIPKSTPVPSHQTDAVIALLSLDRLPAGHNLLDAICREVTLNATHRVGITDTTSAASGGNECAGLAMSDHHRTELAAALSSNHARVGTCIGTAMTNMHHPPAILGSYGWLEGEIDRTPIYQLVGLPSSNPSSAVHGPGWISAATLQNWVSNTSQFPAGLAARAAADAELVLSAVLHPGRVCGPGGPAKVRWNAANQSALARRPPYIGLAHELVHALHDQRGDQPGFDTNTPTGVLYEYLCVGLGPFAAEPITENAVRASAGESRRVQYA
jgi:hypothetical protein